MPAIIAGFISLPSPGRTNNKPSAMRSTAAPYDAQWHEVHVFSIDYHLFCFFLFWLAHPLPHEQESSCSCSISNHLYLFFLFLFSLFSFWCRFPYLCLRFHHQKKLLIIKQKPF